MSLYGVVLVRGRKFLLRKTSRFDLLVSLVYVEYRLSNRLYFLSGLFFLVGRY